MSECINFVFYIDLICSYSFIILEMIYDYSLGLRSIWLYMLWDKLGFLSWFGGGIGEVICWLFVVVYV